MIIILIDIITRMITRTV